MKHFGLIAVVLVSCGTDDCSAGTVDMDGRCIESTDTGMTDSGPDTGDTDAAADAPMACGGACMGATPHCDTDTDTCVACLGNTHCDESAPVCGAGGVCGPCTGPADCAAYPDAPVCGDSGAVDGMCVACVGDSDCTDADAGKCDTGTNTCVPCDDSDQCTEDDAGVCDMSGESGVCVECTIDTEETACGLFSCNPATNECTETTRGDVEACEACVADSECEADHYCVPMTYQDVDRGGYCLLDAMVGGCTRPRSIADNRTSLSGRAGRCCGLSEALATCEAVLALEAGTMCGRLEDPPCPESGLCEEVGDLAGMHCTYECSGGIQCPDAPEPGAVCNDRDGTSTVDYCGGRDS